MSISRLELRRELLALLILFLLPLLWFGPVIFGGKTLLPADNIYEFEPWQSFAAQQGVGTPHNALLSDLVLENYPWKLLIRQAISEGQLPLWNPHLFSGTPFLAAGQHSALFPLSLVYYVLPLPMAYGVFTWLMLALAGINTYIFARVLGLGRAAALFSGIAYMFSGFFVSSVVFQMMIAGAAWLPLVLALIEMVVRKQEEKGNAPFVPVAYIVAGAATIGLVGLAGHVEITYYTLLVGAMYSLWRLFGVWRRLGVWRPVLRIAGWLVFMAVTGLLLAAIQLIPLYELVSQNFRQGSVSYDQVVGWAWPWRQIVTFLIPDFFGNPAHHSIRDWWSGEVLTSWTNALGQTTVTVFWGVKNYVEGANYVGILTLVLAFVACFDAGGRLRGGSVRQPAGKPGWVRPPTGRFYVIGFALLAALSLAFAFGTPLYTILFYGLPGYKQLHSAFRWVFPYTLAVAMLAGFGLDRLQLALEGGHEDRLGGLRKLFRLTYPDSARLAGWVLAAAGAVLLAILLLSRYLPDPFIAIGQRFVDGSDLARAAFADGRQFWSYQAVRLLQLGFMALGSGMVLLLALSPVGQRSLVGPVDPEAERRAQADQSFTWSVGLRVWQAAALLLLLLDLWLIGVVFNARAEPGWLDFHPQAVNWLVDRKDPNQPWRFTTLQLPEEQKTYNANLGMYDGLDDVRGYDSIILRQYAEYMSQMQTQGDLLYNRIGPVYVPNYAMLDDPLFDRLGVRYVVTTQDIPNQGYALAYDGEVRVYENQGALPRVVFVPEAIATPADRLWETIRAADPRQTVVLDASPDLTLPAAVFGQKREAKVRSYGLNDVEVEIDADAPGWVLLNDAYFTGWRAYVRPLAAVDTGAGVGEEEITIHRANGNFRAVYVDEPGWHAVRFHYTPLSFKLGLYTSFLSAVFLALLVGWWGWGRWYRERQGQGAAVQRVAVNSLVPMFMSLVNKFIDYAFALFYLRILNPAGVGAYTFAVQIYTIFEIIVRFGLGTLLTREVSRRKVEDDANRYLANVVVIRTLLWVAALPLMAFVTWLYWRSGFIDTATVWAIGVFALALFFALLSDAFSSVFYAFERMEYPAGVASFTAIARVALGALVLIIGWSFVGLALVSLLINIVQSIWLGVLLRRRVLPRSDRARNDWGLQKWMLRESYPLMLNNLLATAFWRIDILIMTPIVGAFGVGLYSAAYKYIDGLNVIPSYFTLAVFPVMARFAGDDPLRLVRTHKLALRLLTMIAIPLAVVIFFAAEPLILILGGQDYVPGAVTALRILVLSIPIGFMNSVTHYVLIAVDQQRLLTRVFVLGVIFNVGANLVLVPRLGVPGAALVTILSEIILFIPFYLILRRRVGPLPWFDLLWRQTAAGLAMAATFVLVGPFSLLLAILLASGVYGLALIITGAHRAEDMAAIWQALPLRRLQRMRG